MNTNGRLAAPSLTKSIGIGGNLNVTSNGKLGEQLD